MNPTKTRRQSLSQSAAASPIGTLINLHSDPNRSGQSVDWLSLPYDVLLDVLSRLDSLEDFFAFRAVCRSWRSLRAPFPALSAHPPLLLLSCFPSFSESLYDLRRRRLYKIRLPWSPPSRCSLAFSHGFFITVSNASASGPSELLLWNLLSGDRILLSGARISLPEAPHSLPRVILSSSPASSSPASSVCSVVCFRPSSRCFQFCSLGDPLRIFHIVSTSLIIQDMIFFRGRLYALILGHRLVAMDLVPPRAQLTLLESTITPNSDVQDNDGKWMLAESEGNLLLVVMFHYVEFSVFRWEFEGGGWRKLSDLGGRALFLDDNGFAASMLPTCSAVKGNCIYFASLGSGYLEFHLQDQSLSVISLDLSSLPPHAQRQLVPKIWVFPSLCCL